MLRTNYVYKGGGGDNMKFHTITKNNYLEYIHQPKVDLDSLTISSDELDAYGKGMHFILATGKSQIRPGTQSKLQKAINLKGVWWQFKLGISNGQELYVLFTHSSPKDFQKLHARFFIEVIKKAAKSLPKNCNSHRYNISRFKYGDRKANTIILEEDWNQFSNIVAKILPLWMRKNGIQDLQFARWIHGRKNKSPASLFFFFDLLNVNRSANFRVIQIHFANDFNPKEQGIALLMNIKKMQEEEDHFSATYNIYRPFFLFDYGHITSKQSFQAHPNLKKVSRIQTYNPELHSILNSKTRQNNFFFSILCGKLWHSSTDRYKSLKNLKMDVLSSLGEHKNLLELITTMLTLRLEEVATFLGDSALDGAISYHDNVKMKNLISLAEEFLAKGFITMINNDWSDYVKQSIGSEFDLLYKSVCLVKKNGGENVVRSLAEHIYNASNKLNFFCNGRPWHVDCRRLYKLMVPGEGVERVGKFKDGVDSLGRMQFRDRSSIEEHELFQLPNYQRRRLPWRGPQFMLDVVDIIFWRSAVMEDDFNENKSNFTTREQRKEKENEKAVWALLLLLGNCARLQHGFPEANRTLALKSMFKNSAIQALLHRHDSSAQIRGRALASEIVQLILHPKSAAGSMIISTLSPTRFKDKNFRMLLAKEVKENVELFPMSLLDEDYDTYEWKYVIKSKVNEAKVGDTPAVQSCANLTGKKKHIKGILLT